MRATPENNDRARRRPLPLRARGARWATRAVSRTSRRLGLGSGSTIGGRVGLAIDRDLLAHLGRSRPTALVSGTNGKTTTTRMLADAVATIVPVATSRAGANMTAGLVAALAAAPVDAVGVLEVDEGHLPEAVDALAPTVVALLNLSRDQLDRVSEVRLLAERWRRTFDGVGTTVVANADDPLVVYATEHASDVRYVATGGQWHEDAHHCPRCNARITYFSGDAGGGWSCTCGFARPPLEAWITTDGVRFADGSAVALELALPGAFNRANAAIAIVAATVLGVDRGRAAAAIGEVDEIEGRFAAASVDGRSLRLLLAKNPAGFSELLELVRSGDDPLVIAINAQIADGHDPSWLWDVPFEVLAGRRVVATGERAADLAVRLLHAGATVDRVDDQRLAVGAAPAGTLTYIGNYTAFQHLRQIASRPPARPPSDRRRRSAGPSSAPRAPSTSVSQLRVVVVHPDLLGTYGDGGNGRVFANRAAWRGIGAELIYATSDRPLPEGGDLYLLGGGEDGPQLASCEALRAGTLARAVDRGAVVLAVCAGYQILGNSFPAPDGSLHPGVGLLDVSTVRGTPRAVGELLVGHDGGSLTGFENHGGRTVRSDGVVPLGPVTVGIGNGDGTDGAVVGRVFGTYLHGPLLARNPTFADALLALVTGTTLEPVTEPFADALHRERIALAGATKPQRVARGR